MVRLEMDANYVSHTQGLYGTCPTLGRIQRHVDPLLGKDREMSDYITVARQQLRQQTQKQFFFFL